MWHFSNVYLSSFWDLYLFIIAGSWFSIQCSLQPALQPFWPQCLLMARFPKPLALGRQWGGNHAVWCWIAMQEKGQRSLPKHVLKYFFHIQDLFGSLGLSCVKFHCFAKTFSHAQPSADIWKRVLYLVKTSSLYLAIMVKTLSKKKLTWPPSCPGWVESQSCKIMNWKLAFFMFGNDKR